MDVFGKEVRKLILQQRDCYPSYIYTPIYVPRCSLTESIPKEGIRESVYRCHRLLNCYYRITILVYFVLHKRQSQFLYTGIKLVLLHICFADFFFCAEGCYLCESTTPKSSMLQKSLRLGNLCVFYPLNMINDALCFARHY